MRWSWSTSPMETQGVGDDAVGAFNGFSRIMGGMNSTLFPRRRARSMRSGSKGRAWQSN
jgi:hypothetical protein